MTVPAPNALTLRVRRLRIGRIDRYCRVFSDKGWRVNTRTRSKDGGSTLDLLMAWLLAGTPILLLCGLIAGVTGTVLGGYLHYSFDLPKIPDLRAYRPKTVSTFHADDGTVIGVFYREKRFPVPLDSVPEHVIQAFIAAEDKHFFDHPGIDWTGIARAIVRNIKAGKLAEGGSTITQQVTRNLLLTREKTFSRKIREMILAVRVERALTKREILGIYLNQIYLGRGAYGVESAARTYFGKSCTALSLSEAAFLAGLVPGPSNYSGAGKLEAGIERRSYVLESMLRLGFITRKQFDAAGKEELVFRGDLPSPYQRAPYFTEAVRRYIVEKYGEDRLYNEGLQVWTTCNLHMRDKAVAALLDGTREWEDRHRRPRGLVERLSKREFDRFIRTAPSKRPEQGELVTAVVLKNLTPEPKKKRGKENEKDEEAENRQECLLAVDGKRRFRTVLESPHRYRPRDVLRFLVTKVDKDGLELDHHSLPVIEGALVSIENRTGYVKTLVGGLDFERSRFNRAVQALRQPGSAFKPFVYTAALEWEGYSPFTVLVDEPLAIMVDPEDKEWIPANADGEFRGPIDVTGALTDSRNTATVKLMLDTGIEPVITMARRMGIDSALGRNISLCLGVSEVTPLELTSAYSVFPNLGTRVEPVLVKKVVDRFGNVLEDNTAAPVEISRRTLTTPIATEWLRRRIAPVPGSVQRHPGVPRTDEFGGTNGFDEYPPGYGPHGPTQPSVIVDESLQEVYSTSVREDPIGSSTIRTILSMPHRGTGFETTRREPPRRVISPQTAYLMLTMLRKTCQSGTAGKVRKMRRGDLAGKTGTTDDCGDAWFIGFNPEYTTGVWVGYDQKKSLGRREYGNRAALPIWMEFMAGVLGPESKTGYPVPPGVVFWDEQKARSGNAAALLLADADFRPDIPIKRVSPMDRESPAMAGGYGWHGYTGGQYPSYALSSAHPFGPQGTYGMPVAGGYGGYDSNHIRVFNPAGEFLGYAPLGVDEKGNMVVLREEMYPPAQQFGYPEEVPYYEEAPTSDVETLERNVVRSLLPRAAQFFGDLHRTFTPRSGPGWPQ